MKARQLLSSRLVSADGIIVCADGKVTQESNDSLPRKVIPQQAATKLFTVQGRAVVSHAGIIDFSQVYEIRGKKQIPVKIPYSVTTLINYIRRASSPMFTVHKIADLMRNELEIEFTLDSRSAGRSAGRSSCCRSSCSGCSATRRWNQARRSSRSRC